MSRTQGSEITRAMEEQKELEQRFEALVTARATLRTMPNKNKLKEVGVQSPKRKCFANGSGGFCKLYRGMHETFGDVSYDVFETSLVVRPARCTGLGKRQGEEVSLALAKNEGETGRLQWIYWIVKFFLGAAQMVCVVWQVVCQDGNLQMSQLS